MLKRKNLNNIFESSEWTFKKCRGKTELEILGELDLGDVKNILQITYKEGNSY